MRDSPKFSRVGVEMKIPFSSHLRELSRRRLLEEMLRKVLEHGALQTTEVALRLDGSESERRFGVLVVDQYTLRMITAVCQIQNLVEEGVCLVERIDCHREALPTLDAIYFISPTGPNVRQLIEDATGVGKRGDSKYRNFHVFFTHKISDSLMTDLARSKETVLQIGSFAEANLSFVTYDSRTFHFADDIVLENVLREESRFLRVSQIAERLATLFASIGVLQPKIRAQRSSGRGMNAASRLAVDLQLRLSEIESKGPLFRQEQVPIGPHTLVIMERSYDWPAVLAHDFHYESATYDLLDGGPVSIDEGVYRHRSGGTEKSFALGDEKDTLWQLYRHMPCWEVGELVVQEVGKWRKQDEAMRERSAAATRGSSMATMATRAMNALQSLPEHKERFAKLEVHSELIHKVNQLLEGQKLADIGAFEQDMLTGVDSSGKDVMPRRIREKLKSYLNDPYVPNIVKQRLLMLFFACEDAGRDSDTIKAMAREKMQADGEVATSPLWLSNAAMSVDSSGDQLFRKRQFYKEKIRRMTSDNPMRKLLTRWQPKVREIMEQAADGRLSQQLFPEVGVDDDATRQHMPHNPASGLVVVYVIGGLTLTEARQAHEVSRALGVDVFVGGDCMLTARALTEELKRYVLEGQSGSFD